MVWTLKQAAPSSELPEGSTLSVLFSFISSSALSDLDSLCHRSGRLLKSRPHMCHNTCQVVAGLTDRSFGGDRKFSLTVFMSHDKQG